ncbi:MAG: gamma-glutamylcyclotransferase [Cyanobacteria bacterium P01_E01_bin.34]
MQADVSEDGLVKLLQTINDGRRYASQSREVAVAEAIVEQLFSPSTRLAVYGTLAPGEENDWALKSLQGQWNDGFVRGNLFPPGSWGGGIEYPGFKWEVDGNPVAVKVFESAELSTDWERLDAFEGDKYQRILVLVESGFDTAQIANLYSMRA